MSTEELVENLGQKIGRRDFLTKLGAGAVGALMGLMGLPRTVSAQGGQYKCCNLCQPPSPSWCSGAGCDCVWCWVCLHAPLECYRCCECFQDAQYCGGQSCTSVNCSWIEPVPVEQCPAR